MFLQSNENEKYPLEYILRATIVNSKIIEETWESTDSLVIVNIAL